VSLNLSLSFSEGVEITLSGSGLSIVKNYSFRINKSRVAVYRNFVEKFGQSRKKRRSFGNCSL
jgi:hypothetical protein